MIRLAVCDDEQYDRERIRQLLAQYLDKKQLEYTIHLFSSGREFLSREENAVKYDAVFMDISMDEMDGLETARQIRAFHSETCIVLVTSFINYVLEGYKVNAVRYLMKDSLEAALPECMDAILRKMRLRQVAFVFTEGEKRLYTDNLLYVESRKHKAVFYYLEAEPVNYQIYCKLDEVEERLTEYDFLRVHKSYLVNMRHIRKISNYTVFLDTGLELPVPRLRYQAVKEAFADYKGAL